MSAKRTHGDQRRAWALGLLPTAKGAASEKVQLALRLRNEASLTGRCACGAVREDFEVLQGGAVRPVARIEPAPGRVFYSRFRHEDDCPAISAELDRALERGEISDPAGDLFHSLGRRA